MTEANEQDAKNRPQNPAGGARQEFESNPDTVEEFQKSEKALEEQRKRVQEDYKLLDKTKPE